MLEPKRNEDILLEQRIGEIRESNQNLMECLKAHNDMKMALLYEHATNHAKLVNKLLIATYCVACYYSTSIGNVSTTHAIVFASHKLLAMHFLRAHNSLNVLPFVLIKIWNSFAASCVMYSKVCMEFSLMPAKLCSAWLTIVSAQNLQP